MIFLQILKILGIILGIILLIIIGLVLLILFFPIFYRVNGEYKGQIQMKIKASWLFNLISFHYSINNNNTRMYLQILFWKKTFEDDTNNKSQKSKKKKAYSEEDLFDEKDETSTNNTQIENKEPSLEIQKEETKQESKSKSEKCSNKKQKRWQIASFIAKMKEFILKIKEFIQNCILKIDKINMLLKNENKKKAIFHIKDEIFLLLRKISPSKLYLDGVFSTGSPDWTGQMLGIIAMFPITYKNRWKIWPDFESEDAYLICKFDVKGRVFLYQIVGIIVRLVFDRNVRNIYHDIMDK